MDRIGIVGLGRMGSAIAGKLSAEGRDVATWTRSGRSLGGIEAAGTLADLAARSDVLVLSLYDDAAVAEVLDALMACDLAGRLVVETSTVVPGLVTDRAARFADAGAGIVDAPISGGPDLIAQGACGIFVGGDAGNADRARAALTPISGRIFHVGPLGTGLVMKTINNTMIQCYFNGLAEVLPLARRAGLPLETALRILTGGPAGMPMVADRLPKILGEDDTVGFTIDAAHKDNDVFARVAEAHGIRSEVLETAARRQREAIAAGLGGADPAALASFAYTSG